MATIRLEFSSIDNIIDLPSTLSRVEKIAQQRQAIYQFRNQLLSKALGLVIQEQDITCTEFGKPYLKYQNTFAFNHSHSQKNYVLAMSHQLQNLGVDIEDLDRSVRFEALAKHAFHPQELNYWYELEKDTEYWFKVWTTKEAILKASGLGIRLDLHTINTTAHPIQNGGMCSHPKLGTFAYQNMRVGNVMISTAWLSECSCRGFNWPKIEIITHPI